MSSAPCLNLFSCPVTHWATSSFLWVKNLLRVGKFLMAPFQWTSDGVLRSVSIRRRPTLNILTSSPVRLSDAHAHLWKSYIEWALPWLINPSGPDLGDLLHVKRWASLEPMTLADKWKFVVPNTCYKWSVKANLFCSVLGDLPSEPLFTLTAFASANNVGETMDVC